MYSEEDLTRAVAAGVMGHETAAEFRRYVTRLRGESGADEERFRLLTGFNDIFVVIASVLLLAAIAWLGSRLHAALGAAGVALASWGLAEYFVRQKRQALPAIVLLVSFVGGVGSAVLDTLGRGGWQIGAAAAMAVLAAYLHWKRFAVPITVAAGAGAAVVCVLGLVSQFTPLQGVGINLPLLVSGVGIFGLAMYWDMQDRERVSRRSDVAFWLHLLAAPLLVHPLVAALGILDQTPGVGAVAAMIAFYVILGVVSLGIDRRALMVSALGYVLYAFGTLLQTFGSVSAGLSVAALIIGAALLLLSALWHPARARVVARLPLAWQARLPAIR